MKKQKPTSWLLIFVLLSCLPPVGLILLFSKLLTEKDNYASNGQALKIISYLLLFFTVFIAILWTGGNITDSNGNPVSLDGLLLLDGFLLFLTVLTYIKGKQFIHRGQAYEYQFSLLPQNGSISIRQLASAVKLSYIRTYSDLQWMIHDGYLRNARIDPSSGQLVYEEPTPCPPAETEGQTVICPYCCGQNTVRSGSTVKCCYCDSTFEI